MRPCPAPRWPRLAALAIAAGALAPIRDARADDEQALSAGVGWASFSVPGVAMPKQAPPSLSPDVGGAVAVSYERAISTELSLRGEAAAGVFHGGQQGAQSPTAYAALGDVGAVFRFDVLKVVPYAFVGIGGMATSGGPIDRGATVTAVIGGGVDWLVDRHRSLGVEARLASFAGDITVVTVGVRGTVRWGAL